MPRRTHPRGNYQAHAKLTGKGKKRPRGWHHKHFSPGIDKTTAWLQRPS